MIGKKAQAFLALAVLLASLVSTLGAAPVQASSLQPSVGGEGVVRPEPGPPYRQMDSGLWPSLADLPVWESYDASSLSEAASPGEPGSRSESAGQTIALPFDFSLSPVAPPSASPGELDSQSESACQIGASPLDFSISPLAAPPPAPPARPSLRDIPLSLLTVDVTGPDVASLGSPPGSGEVYTAVIRNNSTDVAYGLYLTATHPSFFIHDGGDWLISRTGTITLNVVASTSVITWTPVTTFNLASGDWTLEC